MSVRYGLIAAAALGLAGCATADRVQELEDRLAALEKKVEEQAAAAPAARAAGGAPAEAGVDQAKEDAATKVYEELAALVKDGKMAEAKAVAAKMETEFGDTRMWKRAAKMAQELEVIGKPAPTSFVVDKWFQNEASINFASSSPTLVVFWEEWCPHCRREVPNLEATYNKFKGQGLQMVGVTKVTRKSTEESVTAFIAEQKVTYPMAKETGELSTHFNVSGIPAAAVVKNGEIVWRGHPARITDEMIQGWL